MVYSKYIQGWFICLIALFSCSLSAQKGLEVGAHAGVMHYYGDLNPTYKVSDPHLNLGLKFRRNFNERICVTASLDYGKVSGSDADSNNAFERRRNLDFTSTIFDAGLAFEFNFFPYLHGSQDNYYTPYLFGGLSLMKFNPKAEYEGVTYELNTLFTEAENVAGASTVIRGGGSYGLVTPSFLYGFGFKWDINRDFSFNIQLSGRLPVSDRIDDVQGLYNTNLSGVAQALSNRSGDTGFGRPGTQRGDGISNDSVYLLNIGLVRFFGQLHCPEITRNLF